MAPLFQNRRRQHLTRHELPSKHQCSILNEVSRRVRDHGEQSQTNFHYYYMWNTGWWPVDNIFISEWKNDFLPVRKLPINSFNIAAKHSTNATQAQDHTLIFG